MSDHEADRMAHALDALADAVGLTGRYSEIEYLAEVTRRVVALRARAETAERERDEARREVERWRNRYAWRWQENWPLPWEREGGNDE